MEYNMTTLDTTTIETAVMEAFAAAKEASLSEFNRLGGDSMSCGFAWVTVKPGTSKVARYLKAIGEGKAAYGGGTQIWNPGKLNVQNIDIKEEGAYAFARVLRAKLGVKVIVDSRLD
jgi:hypothetical protein